MSIKAVTKAAKDLPSFGNIDESKVLKNKSVIDELYGLFPDKVPLKGKTVQETRKIFDDRQFTKVWKKDDKDIPLSILALMKETLDDFDDDDFEGFTIYYFMGFKNTTTIIPPPSVKVFSRVIYNIGNKEIYTFETAPFLANYTDTKTIISEKLNGKAQGAMDLDGTSCLLTENSYRNLGWYDTANYKVKISGRAPENIPDIVDPGKGKIIKGTKFYRPSNYHRITIVIDIEGKAKKMQKVMKHISEKFGSMTVKEATNTFNELMNTDDSEEKKVELSMKEKKEFEKLI